eukprot:TRINITY_DN12936_c0_g1_i3.p1 TRINITY_DN12936_c0_g1~~TRINITY_DN12936_c0_g1_i3.p1  ORF type:complete len:555 (-),score=43.94 TRINITY_DN12936_c0_g1_i3:119-1783(-)
MVIAGGIRFQAFLFLIRWGQVTAQVSSSSVSRAGPYAAGLVPTGLTFQFDVGTQATSGTVTITLSKALFGADETGIADSSTTIEQTQTAGSPVLTYALSGSGTVLTGTLSSGSFNTGSTYSISVLAAKMAAAIPSPTGGSSEAVTASIAVNGNTAETGISVYTIVSAPTVTLTPASYSFGDQPTKLEISITLPKNIFFGSFTITPSVTLFTGSATSDVTIAGASTLSGTPSISAFTTAHIIVTVAGSSSIGETLKLEVAQAGLATLPSPTGAVTFNVEDPWTDKFVNYAPMFTIVAGVAGSDPIARWGNMVREFELPPGRLTLLLKTPIMDVFGSVFEGGGSYEQWFDRFVLTDHMQTRFLDMKIKKNLLDYNRSKSKPGTFKTIDVILGVGAIANPSHVIEIRTDSPRIPRSWFGSEIVMRRIPRYSPTRINSLGPFPRECADIAGDWLHFYICSTPATEYYAHLSDLAIKYAHFDMAMVEMLRHEQVTGLFPELWGLQPMSEMARAFVKNTGEDTLAGTAQYVRKTDPNSTCSGVGTHDCKEDHVDGRFTWS